MAQISNGFSEDPSFVRFNGKPSLGIVVYGDERSDIIQLTQQNQTIHGAKGFAGHSHNRGDLRLVRTRRVQNEHDAQQSVLRRPVDLCCSSGVLRA